MTRDIPVDGAPMVLPVPDGLTFVGDSFPKAHWTLEPYLKNLILVGSASFKVD